MKLEGQKIELMNHVENHDSPHELFNERRFKRVISREESITLSFFSVSFPFPVFLTQLEDMRKKVEDPP